MELRLPLEVSPGREATCRAVFGTWGFFPDDARAGHCPFVLTSFTGWSSERCPGIGFLPRGDREIGVLRNVEPPTRPRLECLRYAEADEVDALGIVPATRLAMTRALGACGCEAQHLLVDALRLPKVAIPQEALIKGDRRCLSIAAASVLAKTARDQVMLEWDAAFPGYGFAHNKGYGTSMHRAALEELGPCVLHRRSFAPIRARLVG